MRFRADFHIHSCLSPCASLEMSPAAIVLRAREMGLDAVALSDHNCAYNLPAFAAVCGQQGMDCLFGIEVTTAEEAHMLCLFDDLDAAIVLGERIYANLPSIPNQPDCFGDQPIVDAFGEITGFARKYLISASPFDLHTLLNLVHDMGGLFIPAHIDRRVFGIVAQLGFLPDEDFDAVELTPQGDPGLAGPYPVLRNSDAHRLDAIGSGFTDYELDHLSVASLKAALARGSV